MSRVYDILRKWKEECGSKGVTQFKYSFSTGILTIYTAFPGYFIGKAGCYVDKYTEVFKNEIHGFNSIKFEVTDYYYIA